MSARTILHVDLDAFYASVEQRDDPTLVGKPVVVGGDARRGVVCAASYEARKFGIHSAMSMFEAMKRCPRAVVIRPRMAHYADVSHQFFEVLGHYSPLIEALSLDEAFLDVTGEERLFGDGAAIGRLIKDRVRAELRIVASVGVAPCKLVAKIASDLGKPDGLLVVPDGTVATFLAPLPMSRLWGVGEVTGRALAERGLRTIGDVAAAAPPVLEATVGKDGARRLAALARGDDDRAVEPERAPVSVGNEDTFAVDLRDRAAIGEELLAQADRACERLRHAGGRARTITVKVKYSDHELVTRRETLARATADGRLVGEIARRLLAAVPAIERRGVRLTGVSLSGLEQKDAPRQLDFDTAAAEKGETLGATLDEIKARFGQGMVKRAVHVRDDSQGDDK